MSNLLEVPDHCWYIWNFPEYWFGTKYPICCAAGTSFFSSPFLIFFLWHFDTLSVGFSSSTYVTSLSLNDLFCQFFVFWGLRCFAVECFLTQSCCLTCVSLNHSAMFVNSQVCVVFYSLQVSLWKTNKQRKFVTGQLCISSSPDRKPGQLANAEHKNPLPK